MTEEPLLGTVDPAVLEVLGEELGDLSVARRIATVYLELLEERVQRLGQACDAGEVNTALERTLTLKVTSATVGATGVSGCAADIEKWLRSGRVRQLAKGMERLRRAAAETSRSGLGSPRPAGSPD